jgi:hypothetical protein
MMQYITIVRTIIWTSADLNIQLFVKNNERIRMQGAT